ncbi:MAG: alcohol dehydrogenase catalytic domain-containing protein, partial [Gammaproteobacteria bacterium]|nr:alcohol dehydrogenase catalytic domain-containing protein [Gammaproteobacteria bacterium]
RLADGETPGHEIAGTVEDAGSRVTRCKSGDRVVVQPFWGCGTCSACRSGKENYCPDIKAFGFHVPGGFSEYIAAREDIVLPFASNISFDEAVLTHHIAVNLNGIKSSGAKIEKTSSVAVFGTGNLGLLMVMMVKALGASKIFAVDIEPSRLDLAAELSGSIAVNAAKCDPAEMILQETGGMGVDISIELAGGTAPTLEPA